MDSRTGPRGRWARVVAELAIIIVGVLIALAADRWNQARTDRAAETVYLERFSDEITADTAQASSYLRDRPSILASLDSLVAFADGGPPPPNLPATTLAVTAELALPPTVAWTEIQATNSLGLISDPAIREALTTYYSSRERLLLMWSRQDSRARDPFFDLLYRTGLYNPRDDFRASGSQDQDAFRNTPGLRASLLAVAAGHYFQRALADQMITNGTAALTVLESSSLQ